MLRNLTFLREFLFLAVIIFLFFVSFASWVGYQAFNKQDQLLKLQLQSQSYNVERTLTDTIDYTGFVLNHLASQIKPYQGNNERIEEILATSSSLYKGPRDILSLSMFSWVNHDFQLTVNSERGIMQVPLNLKTRDYLPKTVTYPGELQLGKPIYGAVSKQWIIPGGVGIRDEYNDYIGATIVGIAITGLTKKLLSSLTDEHARFIVIEKDSYQTVFASHNFSQTHKTSSVLAELSKQLEGFIPVNKMHWLTNVYTYYKHSTYPYIVIVYLDPEYTSSIFKQTFMIYGFAFFVALMLLIGLMYLLKKRLITPIQTLAAVAEEISKGQEPHSLPDYPERELRYLKTQLDQVRTYTVTLKATQDKLQKANDLVKSALGYMAHELKTPLGQILAFSELLLHEYFEPLGSKSKEYVQHIFDTGTLQQKLINSFLKSASYDPSDTQLHIEEVDIKDLLQKRIGMVQKLADEKHIKIKIELQDNLPLLLVDELKIGQVMLNLLTNAIKYNREHGFLTIRIFTSTIPHQDSFDYAFIIEFSDTGIGLTEKEIECIFDKYTRITNDQTRHIEGTGLGLAFTKEMIEAHGGSIGVTSEPSIGTTFTVILPGERMASFSPEI